MSRLALALLLLTAPLASPSLAAEAAPEKTLVRPKLAAGQKWSFDTVLERQESRPDGTKPTLRATVPSTLEVIGRSGEGWELAWREGKPVITIEATDPNRASAARLAAEAANGLALRFVTDANGVPLRLINADEYIGGLRKALKVVADTSFDPSAKALASELITRLTSPEMVAAGALRAPSLLLSCGGSNLAPGEQVSSSATLENPVGGPPLPSTLSMTAAAAPAAKAAAGAKTLTLKVTQRIDKVAAQDAIHATLARIGVPAESVGEFTIEVLDEGTWTLDRATLMPTSLEHVRTMKIGPMERVERRSIKPAAQAGAP